MRHLLTIDDLSETEIDEILHQARSIQDGKAAPPKQDTPKLVGLLFLQASLRTRTGFEAACKRLGWQTVSVQEQRSAASISESVEDTFRILSGIVDLIVARLPQPIATVAHDLSIPLINGGDFGPNAEHPTQALIDLFAIEQELGDVSRLHIAICGDMRLRATRSLLRLLNRRPPARLSLVSVPDLLDRKLLNQTMRLSPTHCGLGDIAGADVLYVTGIPHQAIPEDVRDTLRVTADALKVLPSHSIVLSPLPVIDEIDADARRDPRIKMFTQSDRAQFVRAAILRKLASHDR